MLHDLAVSLEFCFINLGRATFTILVSNQDFPVSYQFHHVQVKLIIGDSENVSERALYVGMTFITSRMPDSILESAKKDITRRN